MKVIVAFVLVLGAIQAYAGTMSRGQITKLMVDANHGDKIFVRVQGSVVDAPECSNNGAWQYVLPLDSELRRGAMMSFLLSAHIAGKQVRLDGKGVCDVYSTIETLTRVEFLE